MDALLEHQAAYKLALNNQDTDALLREKAWLTTAATSALLEQDSDAMRKIRACCADLSSLADHYDCTGQPGDRWRALGDVLTVALDSGKPLVCLRLALPASVSGMLLQKIDQHPGLTPTALAQHCQKSTTHVSNELKKLEEAGLIDRLKRGKNIELFISIIGKAALASVAPSTETQSQAPAVMASRADASNDYAYADPSRLAAYNNSCLPFQQATQH